MSTLKVNLTKVPEKKNEVTWVGGIAMGQVFMGTIGGHTGPFLRSFRHIVKLYDPRQCWSWDEGETGPSIRGYRPVESAVLEIVT